MYEDDIQCYVDNNKGGKQTTIIVPSEATASYIKQTGKTQKWYVYSVWLRQPLASFVHWKYALKFLRKHIDCDRYP